MNEGAVNKIIVQSFPRKPCRNVIFCYFHNEKDFSWSFFFRSTFLGSAHQRVTTKRFSWLFYSLVFFEKISAKQFSGNYFMLIIITCLIFITLRTNSNRTWFSYFGSIWNFLSFQLLFKWWLFAYFCTEAIANTGSEGKLAFQCN